MIETAIGSIILVSLILYALLGGADFGGGIWDLLAFGPRAERQRATIARAVAPVWEANHVWLILVVVILFTAFPKAFAAMMIALHIPITLMLIGIVLRGSAFAFRKTPGDLRWSRLFGISSAITPFFQGMVLGALTTGEIRVVDGAVASGYFAGWPSPFAVACGFFALTLFSFLAATYLTLDSRDDGEVQSDFRRRALWCELILGMIALIVFATSERGAPRMYGGLTAWWAPWLLAATSLCALAACTGLWVRRFALARLAAIGQVTLILTGWCVSQFPHLITPDLTVYNTAAPLVTLELLLAALALGALVLFPSLAYLFTVFKSSR
ncbi:MAG TPA: cytochrome d ubiquinol oxidase subunit II [Verrucomicrobiae bacterium]|nr:cytochrome d ubiquinol oxidase subunit II [Verrucomicrobiae bacterium]